MSQVNQETSEDLDDHSSDLSETSTSSTCSGSTTTASGSTNSDEDVESDASQDHRDCQSSSNFAHEKTNLSKLSNTHGSCTGSVPNSVPRNECDTNLIVNDSSTTGSTTSSSKDLQEEKKYCQCFTKTNVSSYSSSTKNSHPKQERVTYQKSSTSQNNSASIAHLDKSASERLLASDETQKSNQGEANPTVNHGSLGSSYSNLSGHNLESTSTSTLPRHTLRPAPSPISLNSLDTNNNKNEERDSLLNKRTNFSKSASGSRLIHRNRNVPSDSLPQDCLEKKHSNRRQFLEHWYNSKTQLPSSNTFSSSFNISTPLNRLSECDAITKRLLSSPIRTSTLIESPTRRGQQSEVDKSRRASLGTNSMTDQVFLFTSSQFKSMDSRYGQTVPCENSDNQPKSDVRATSSSNEVDARVKQQQSRSLSVCDEETLNPRFRNPTSNHSSNLNRAISLACESNTSASTRRITTLIPLFGCDIKSLEQFRKLGSILPPVIDSAVEHVLIHGIDSVGIFRKSGVRSRISTLKQRIEANQNTKLDELNLKSEFSIYDIADLIKLWFRELKPVPLMTKELIKIISPCLASISGTPHTLKRGNSSQQESSSPSVDDSSNIGKRIDSNLTTQIDSITTPTQRALLLRALNFLAQISSRCDHNQMTSQNLAICLTPSLCETKTDTNSIILDQKALEYCIDNHRLLFARTYRN